MGLFNGVAKKVFESIRLKKRVFDPEKVSIEDVQLPKIISDLGDKLVSNMIKEEISAYRSLGYKDKSLGALEVNTYHSFQIGVILKYLQLDHDLFIPNKNEIFPSFVKDYTFESLQVKVFDIIDLYDKIAPKDPSKQNLIDHIKWSPLDATYLLYYLTVYKEKNEI